MASAIQAGGPVKVTLELPDGQVIEMSGLVVEMSVGYPYTGVFDFENRYHGPREYEMTIRGTEAWSGLTVQKAQRDATLQHAHEWKCSYCGHVNPVKARYCGADDVRAVGCGGARPYVFER